MRSTAELPRNVLWCSFGKYDPGAAPVAVQARKLTPGLDVILATIGGMRMRRGRHGLASGLEISLLFRRAQCHWSSRHLIVHIGAS